MANLKDLLYGYEEGSTTTPAEFLLENTNTWLEQNGGCAYVWTVPATRSKMVFEIWSGGSSGGRSCCCMQGKGKMMLPGRGLRNCFGGGGRVEGRTNCVLSFLQHSL